METLSQWCRRVVPHNQQEGLGQERAPRAQTRKTTHWWLHHEVEGPVPSSRGRWLIHWFLAFILIIFIKLLEQNTAPGMIARIFQEEKQMEDLIDYFKEIWRVSSARESLDFIMDRTQYRSNHKSSEHKDSNAMDVSTAQHGNSRSCFNCRDTGHYAKDCRKLKVECPNCHFLAGGHKKECKCSNMWGVRATNSTQEAAMS